MTRPVPAAPRLAFLDEEVVAEEFLGLVLSDPDLLAVEFDAIVATLLSAPSPPQAPRIGAGGRGPGDRSVTGDATGHRRSPARPRHPGVGGWGRQRSPPAPGTRVS